MSPRGPELLARTHYALGSGVSTIDTMPALYAQWERWAADVAESHTTYLPLVRFRSPQPLSSWVTALLAVLDSAALFLSLSPKAAPVVPARLCLRSGLVLHPGRGAMGLQVPDEPDPSAGISLTYEEFLDAVERMKKVDFPLERYPVEPGRLHRLAPQLRAGRLRGRVRAGRAARPLVGFAHTSH